MSAKDEWNDTRVDFPGAHLALHQLIERQVALTPDDPALAFEGRRLSYRELNRRADLLAHHLRSLGAGPESLVGLFVPRSLDSIVGLLGILKSGAAYVPLDPVNPPERIEFVIKDAGLRWMVTHSDLLASHGASAEHVIRLDAFDWTAAPASSEPAETLRPDHLAYVIYTSGSTGRPKGVGVEHRNIVNYVLGVSERFRFTAGLHHALVSTLAADLGHTVVFPSLATGGCLHVLAQERTENPAMLAEYFVREGIDVLKIVPSHLTALLAGRNPEQVLPKSRLILGGEASRLDWIDRLRALAPTMEIHNHYGPTETTVGVLTHPAGAASLATASPTLPLGRPLANCRVYVLDEHGSALSTGEPGELFVGGEGVARGYLTRPELTAEKFLPDPFHPGGRMYRTGDRGRRLLDGTLEFLGRVDHQVKIHGNRIELGEIEEVLRSQPGVREAVVVTREDASGQKDLVAYVTSKREHQPLWEGPALHVLPDGSPVAHLNRNETDYIHHEIFVLQAYLRHGVTIRDGDCIVDAGSNIGLFTTFVNRLARNLKIFSFEPNPTVFACLKANAEAYGTEGRCLPVGLSNEEKTADLTFFEGLSLLSGFYADASTEREVVRNFVLNQQGGAPTSERQSAEIDEVIDERLKGKTVTARLRPLSKVIAEEGIDRIDLLKVNVEKSELDVLRGIEDRDWPKIRQLVIEVDLQKNLAPVQELLDRHGFETVVEQDPLLKKTDLCYVYAIRPTTEGPRLIRDQAPDAHRRSVPAWNGEILSPPSLRAFLRMKLPEYMIPPTFVLLDKLPLTPNGKVDRGALPAPGPAKSAAPRVSAMPQTQTERALAAIWSDLLKVESVGLHDDFFDLGGHSLMAIRSISRIRDQFEVDLQLRNLFEKPTVAGLAQLIDGLRYLATSKDSTTAAAGREVVDL